MVNNGYMGDLHGPLNIWGFNHQYMVIYGYYMVNILLIMVNIWLLYNE